MGHFNDETEANNYSMEYCCNCTNAPHADTDCEIYALHLEQIGQVFDPDSLLHKLIPMAGTTNRRCRLFHQQ